MKIQNDVLTQPNSYLSVLIKLAIDKKLPYIFYHKLLESTYISSKACNDILTENYRQCWSTTINRKHLEDIESKLSVYKSRV